MLRESEFNIIKQCERSIMKEPLYCLTSAKNLIIDTTFARKVGCVIDESRTQECAAIGEKTLMTAG